MGYLALRQCPAKEPQLIVLPLRHPVLVDIELTHELGERSPVVRQQSKPFTQPKRHFVLLSVLLPKPRRRWIVDQ
jgi:hypothetical protein